MTPKEKAIELWGKYYNLNLEWDGVLNEKWAKEGAIITVDEIIPIVNSYENALSASQQSDYLEYWYEVKQEIEKL